LTVETLPALLTFAAEDIPDGARILNAARRCANGKPRKALGGAGSG